MPYLFLLIPFFTGTLGLFGLRVLSVSILYPSVAIAVGYLLVLFVACAAVVQPLFLTILVDGLILEKQNDWLNSIRTLFADSATMPLLVSFVVMMIGLRFAIWGAGCYFTSVFIAVAKSVSKQMRLLLFDSLEKASLSSIESAKPGHFTQAIAGDIDAVEGYLQKITNSLFTATIAIIGTVAVVTWFHWQLGLLLAVINISIVIVSRMLSKRVKQLKKQESRTMAELQSDFLESIEHVRELRASSTDNYFFTRLKQTTNTSYTTSKQLHWITEVISRLSSALHMSGFDIYRIFCVFLILTQSLTIGETLAAINYLWIMIGGMNEIINLQYSHQTAVGAVTRINQINSLESRISPSSALVDYTPRNDDLLVCDSLTFSYTASQPLFTDLNFCLPAQQKIALFGESGAGKSTLVNLLLGLYQPSAGNITLGNTPVALLTTQSRKRAFSAVLQQSALLNDTIRANLCLDEDKTEQALWHALYTAAIDEFVRALPQGLDTPVGNKGIRLSGGERQRIALARALLHPAHIMIFDEATSALDTHTEQLVYSRLKDALAHRSCIFISHRQSIRVLADSAYHLKNGTLHQENINKPT